MYTALSSIKGISDFIETFSSLKICFSNFFASSGSMTNKYYKIKY